MSEAYARARAEQPSDFPPPGSAWPLEMAAEAPGRPAIAPAASPTTAGAKADAGKLGTHLLPTRPLEAIARVLDFGAQKYAPNNWRKGIAYTRVYGAVLRHLWAWWRGEQADPETGLHPLAHAACELLFLLEYEQGLDGERRAKCDDRPEINPGRTGAAHAPTQPEG